jgi:hypothetical protein
MDRIIDGDAIRCGTHGEFEFTGTARNEKSRHREDWESGVDQYIRRLDVLVDEAVPVDLAEHCRQADG